MVLNGGHSRNENVKMDVWSSYKKGYEM